MAQSFTATNNSSLNNSATLRRKVLVTGAAGNIGSYFAANSHLKYALTLMIHKQDEAKELEQYGEVVQGDITDLDRMKTLCQGMDTVVHLAADPSPSATWDSLRELNINGTYNVFIAAKAAGCRRVVYASSIHAVSGYPADVQVKTSEPVNPGDLYGVSKCFGEALGRYMAEQEKLSVIAIRIGGFQPVETVHKKSGVGLIDAWVSQRDLNQLIGKCIDAEGIKFAILHGLSDNRFKRLDISDARELVGYSPEDDASREIPEVKELELEGKVGAHSMQDGGQKSGIREEI